ncbi:MAG: hypothetical protein FJW35_07740 [Acidobacteria bacterium]|nr:hypothetical protein [Acidobacteriota bacterium]
MAGKKKGEKKRALASYEHRDKQRVNNPPVGLVTPDTDPDAGSKQTYAYDPHLDPQLQWAGKAEHTSFEVPTVSLHVHERIDPRTIIEAARKRNGAGAMVQGSLFETLGENPPLRQAVEFYKHAHGWSNRMVAGDSLLAMNSLPEKEGLAGKVQMIYIDPHYGIKYGSNFLPFVNKRDVKDGKDEDLTAEPEQIRALRDTWELGIHSYLTYLRDRVLLARELLTESGSVFVQISDENVHHARELMDVERLRGNREIAERARQIAPSLTGSLSTIHYSQVTIHGFDYYNTKTGGIESGGEDKIAVWLLDTDYDGRSLYPRQVFFPMAGANEGWARLAKNLKTEIDEERIEAYRGTVSLPFEPGGHKRIAVKIVDDRGIESLKAMEVE